MYIFEFFIYLTKYQYILRQHSSESEESIVSGRAAASSRNFPPDLHAEGGVLCVASRTQDQIRTASWDQLPTVLAPAVICCHVVRVIPYL